MQITLEMSQEEVEQLDAIRNGSDPHPSREELAQLILSASLKQRSEKEDALDLVFGMWANRGIDGVDYERQLRQEWEREF